METKQGYFDPKMPYPMDLRHYKATQVEILSIPIGARYIGMEIFAYQENTWWQFKNGVTDPDLLPSDRGSGSGGEGKTFSWTWGDGVDVGGTHLDFVISPAIEGEIVSIESSILFVGGSVQAGNFSIETTNVVDDTIRIAGTAGERESSVEVVLFYARSITGIPRTIIELNDTPNDYAGAAGKVLVVKQTEDGFEYNGDQVAFDGQVRGGTATISFSSTATFDMDDGNIQKMILTANVTSLDLANKVNGSSYRIVLQQGGTGSYTIPVPSASFGARTDNSVDDSGGAGSWEPTTIGSKIIYDITVEPDGDTTYTIETLTV